jgi:RNA polymerase sigma-70 factor (ECF subfamily)
MNHIRPGLEASPSFQDVMVGLRAQDEAAARLVFDRFVNRLIAMARGRLDHRIRQKVDPEDVLQSVYMSFFARHSEGKFEIGGWDGLWAILVVITLRKCLKWNARYRTGGRDIGKEVQPAPSPDNSNLSWEAIDREPTPDEAAVLTETLETVLRGLGGREREMVQRYLQGHTVCEIGAAVGRSERTVLRILERVKTQLIEA